MYGIPLERPKGSGDRAVLTEEESAERVADATRRHNDSHDPTGNYGPEWRDNSPGFGRHRPSRQSSVVIDPADGRIPPRKVGATARPAAVGAQGPRTPSYTSWTQLGTWQRCITRGLPLDAAPYNNGLQIVQSPGVVTIIREMIHEARVIPLDGRPHLPPSVTQYLGDSRGHWENDTLVVDVTNFNGRNRFMGSGKNLHLTERFRRISDDEIEYRFTVDDASTWTRPWTGRLSLAKDDGQYELVEYSCHEGNYAMVDTLTASRPAR
jgi:hypothetical protein